MTLDSVSLLRTTAVETEVVSEEVAVDSAIVVDLEVEEAASVIAEVALEIVVASEAVVGLAIVVDLEVAVVAEAVSPTK